MHLVELPSQLPDAVVHAIVEAANASVPAVEPPHAVWIVSGDGSPSLPRVHQNQAEEYRVGNRVFIYRHGEYAPLSSMLNTASPLLDRYFPLGTIGGDFLGLVAASAARFVDPNQKHADLSSQIEATLLSLALVARNSTVGEASWVHAWWEASGSFMQLLSSRLALLPEGAAPAIELIAACAGMPSGAAAEREGRTSIDAQEVTALVRAFSSGAQRDELLARLEQAGMGAGLPQLSVEEFERSLVSGKHPVQALVDACPAGKGIDLWMSVDREQLALALHPPRATYTLALAVAGTALPALGPATVLLPPFAAGWQESATRLMATVRLQVTVHADAGVLTAARTQSAIVKPRKVASLAASEVQWNVADGTALCTVELKLLLPPEATQLQKVVLQIGVPTVSGSTAAITLYVAPPQASYVCISTRRNAMLVDWALAGEERDLVIDSAVAGATLWVIPSLGAQQASGWSLDGQDLLPASHGALQLDGCVIKDGTLLSCFRNGERSTVAFRQAQAGAAQFCLPMEAAFHGESPSRDPLPDSVFRDDLRAHFEEAFRKFLDGDDSAAALVPFTWVASTRPSPRAGLPSCDAARVLWSPSVPRTGELSESSLTTLLGRPECADLEAAVRALLDAVEQGEPGVTSSVHMSRWSLANISRDTVDGYLHAWIRLARVVTGAERPWALFPFSVIVLDGSDEIVAALLSPLHPIRLAWLYGLEVSFAELGAEAGKDFQRLLQLVEGWNFPAVATEVVEALSPVNFIAARLSSGHGRQYIGWSALAAVQRAQGLLPEVVSGWLAGCGKTRRSCADVRGPGRDDARMMRIRSESGSPVPRIGARPGLGGAMSPRADAPQAGAGPAVSVRSRTRL